MAASSDAPWLQEPGASFVTLTQSGALRGCMGTLEVRQSLLADIQNNARAAAFHDPRFAPLAAQELEATDIEVSVLSALQPMRFGGEADALSQLRPGIDGVVFTFGHHRSTFLPQVWEQLPNPKTFMAHLKRKAGLAADFWADGVNLQRYTVTKWTEPGASPTHAS
jgi:AmmeMemoRadiSam system protein A